MKTLKNKEKLDNLKSGFWEFFQVKFLDGYAYFGNPESLVLFENYSFIHYNDIIITQK